MTEHIEILDTTLRDGEQTCGVSFMPHEKLAIVRMMLEELMVDRIEIASARVSEGEVKSVSSICQWAEKAGVLDKIEVLGFVDGNISVDWIRQCGGKVINLLAKGSREHCEKQLGKTLPQHISDIKTTIGYANGNGIKVNLYLEDWSMGMQRDSQYVFDLVRALANEKIERFMLPDTLGVLNPNQVTDFVGQMVGHFPQLRFDFHAHNDYDMAISNVFAAVKAGVSGLHTTINGLGERAGNASIASVQAILKDHLHVNTNLNEERLMAASRMVESFSGIAIASNQPIVGENVFTQVAGVHADGDSKHNLYCNKLLPERFGRKREYALGKNSGKANIKKNLDELGMTLDEDSMRKVTARIIELGDRKELVTQDDLPFIISDVLKHDVSDEKVRLLGYNVALCNSLKPTCSLRLDINGQVFEETSSGDGQYDAFVRALRKIYKITLERKFPMLVNYAVSIPPGGRTDAFVQTIITWEFEGRTFKTRGLDADQTEAAIKATIKMLNIIENS
ncbi:MAG: 2-isopropylmalate synthase [Bacteroidaceae bacterium]|nr:2-isopropylmalate synthase [Bacteroidaceae bacterium]